MGGGAPDVDSVEMIMMIAIMTKVMEDEDLTSIQSNWAPSEPS